MLTWKFSFLTCDHCFIKLTLLLAEFNVFNQSSFFFLSLLVFYLCVQHPLIATMTLHSYLWKTHIQYSSNTDHLSLWRTLKTHQFWSSESFPTVHKRKKWESLIQCWIPFLISMFKSCSRVRFFCCIPSGGSRPCSREQVVDSPMLVILQSSCESSFYFIPEHKGKKYKMWVLQYS